MAHATVVKWLNRIAILALILLFYGLFAVAFSQVFDLKVLTRTSTGIFAMAIGGLFAIMGATLILNIMLNLSRIADELATQTTAAQANALQSAPVDKAGKTWLITLALIGGFAVIMAVLWAGDTYTRNTKERILLHTAAQLVQERGKALDTALTLPFTITSTATLQAIQNQLMLIQQTDRHVDYISLLVPVQYADEAVVLEISQHSPSLRRVLDNGETIETPTQIELTQSLFKSSTEQRKWLAAVFAGQQTQPLYQYEDDQYQLFYPLKLGNDWVVLYFSDRQAYGKVSS